VPFRLKTILGIAVIEAITLFLLIWTSLNFLRTSNEKALMERASTTAVMFATMTTDAVLSLDLASLESFIEELLKNPGVVYGRIISNSDGILAEGGQAEALTKSFTADSSYRSIDDGVFDAQSEIVVKGITYGKVQLGLSVAELQKLMGTARGRITVLAVAEMALTAFFSFLLGAWLTRQLGSLAEGTRQISRGNLGYQVPIRGRDELAKTAATFNQMSMDLQRSYRQLNDTLAQMRQASRDLKMSEAKMRAVLENAVDAIITIDEGGAIVSFNPAAERIFGYPASDAIGKNVDILVPEPHKSRHGEYIRRYLSTGIARVIGIGREVEGQRKNGERFPLELGVSEILIENQRLFTGIVRDISHRKQVEEELRRHRDNLEQLVEARTRALEETQQRLVEQALEAGRAQLAAMMLHNIGNAVTPLTAYIDAVKGSLPETLITFLEKTYHELRSHSEDLTRFVGKDPRGREVFEYLGELIQNLKSSRETFALNADAEKMETTVNHISDILSLHQANESDRGENRTAVDLNVQVETALKMCQESLQVKGIAVVKDLAADLPPLPVDAERFLQALIHVLRNASDAIEARAAGGDTGRIHVRTYMEKDQVSVEIEDSGIGIEPERLQKLGDPNLARIGATGFGLYFSKMFMQSNNGQLEIASPGAGLGATVTFVFSRSI